MYIFSDLPLTSKFTSYSCIMKSVVINEEHYQMIKAKASDKYRK